MPGTALDHYADYDDWGDASDVKKKGKDRYFEEKKNRNNQGILSFHPGQQDVIILSLSGDENYDGINCI